MEERWDLNPCVICEEYIYDEHETIFLPGSLSGPGTKYPAHIYHFQREEEEEDLVSVD